MNPFRARAARSTIAAGLGLLALAALERPVQARQPEPLLQPTPLVLKDGRIASVSIHVVPFAPGRADLGGEAAARVAELTRVVSTDCFLTAQVIGHIDSSEVAQDDTLTAHRLARSRADAVQASLIGGGLPAKAIASVWDWQFMVRAPRATLWIFQLTVGEDCEGRPLEGALVAQTAPSSSRPAVQPERAAVPPPGEGTASSGAPPAVAQVGEPARPVAPAATGTTAQASQGRADAPSFTQVQPPADPKQAPQARSAEQREGGATVAARPALAPNALTSGGEAAPEAKQLKAETARAAVPAPATSAPAGERQVAQPATQREVRTAVAARPAPATNAPASDKQLEQPLSQPATRTAAAVAPAPAGKESPGDGKVERAEGSLVITFATNSSYFPSGAAKRLRELVAGMAPDHKYEVGLRVAVSGSAKVVGARSPQEAASYNKWLAERRLERVQNWLLEHAAVGALSFKPEFVTDESRQVIVRLAPVG
jgi:outer membrane protein OmpA-like peptidoglycan-associated protein